jgi:hypothetical protein
MKLVIAVLLILLITSCKEKINLLESVNIGYNLIDSVYEVNTANIITNGIVFPDSNEQSDKSVLSNIKFKFSIKKNSSQKLFYKIYYQNESYKFPETDSLAYENFYGSWNDTIGFKEITTENVIDSFIIIGNPRFESKFYGAKIDDYYINDSLINETIKSIKNDEEWYNMIVEKAKKNNYTIDEQIYLDALWVLKDKRNNGNENNRWKRNPRMGQYSALLIVCTEEALKKIPDYIKFINKKNEYGQYVNPYSYFLFGEGSKQDGIYTYLDSFLVKLKLTIKPGTGIYVDKVKLPLNTKIKESQNCGTSHRLFKHALFEHFFSHENKNFKLNTIPVIIDWDKDKFTLNDYLYYKKIFSDTNKRVSSWIRNTSCACENVIDNNNEIEIFTPPSENINNAAKLNVGIKTRIGICYGKITAKVKLAKMLNENNIWNGVTNAIWLITQDLHSWNNRRFSKNGYTPKGNPYGEKQNFTPYSEIDFEIIKASPYWPAHYYKDTKRKKLSEKYDGTKDDTIIIALTNWDLASKDPENFSYPIQYISHHNKIYEAMRWDEYYQALTIRHPISHKEIFTKDYYYFQIEWKPTEIIWRIGPEKNQLHEIGYMNRTNTNIPNNQMVLVFNQEFHLSEWWPVPVYDQDFLPFARNKIAGKIYEITVE